MDKIKILKTLASLTSVCCVFPNANISDAVSGADSRSRSRSSPRPELEKDGHPLLKGTLVASALALFGYFFYAISREEKSDVSDEKEILVLDPVDDVSLTANDDSKIATEEQVGDSIPTDDILQITSGDDPAVVAEKPADSPGGDILQPASREQSEVVAEKPAVAPLPVRPQLNLKPLEILLNGDGYIENAESYFETQLTEANKIQFCQTKCDFIFFCTFVLKALNKNYKVFGEFLKCASAKNNLCSVKINICGSNYLLFGVSTMGNFLTSLVLTLEKGEKLNLFEPPINAFAGLDETIISDNAFVVQEMEKFSNAIKDITDCLSHGTTYSGCSYNFKTLLINFKSKAETLQKNIEPLKKPGVFKLPKEYCSVEHLEKCTFDSLRKFIDSILNFKNYLSTFKRL
ncbi:MAG: hypothetical protein LBK29_01700 [Oscillospiraceae bacterium]|jgi:hypothetical protein|nr:hypothetical protein [Oscillospiraceae bacterium]